MRTLALGRNCNPTCACMNLALFLPESIEMPLIIVNKYDRFRRGNLANMPPAHGHLHKMHVHKTHKFCNHNHSVADAERRARTLRTKKNHHHGHTSKSCHQSPIDLNSNITQRDHHLHGAALVFDWHAASCMDIVNGGYTWTVHCDDRSSGCAYGCT